MSAIPDKIRAFMDSVYPARVIPGHAAGVNPESGLVDYSPTRIPHKSSCANTKRKFCGMTVFWRLA
jgi:hypothetical protein